MEVKKLGEVVTIQRGKRRVAVEDGKYLCFGAGSKPTKRTDKTNTPNRCIRVTAKATLGEVYLHSDPFWAEDSAIILTPKEGLSEMYLFHWLKKNQKAIASLPDGSLIPMIDLERFRNLPFELPSIEYQQELAVFLEVLADDILRLQTNKGGNT